MSRPGPSHSDSETRTRSPSVLTTSAARFGAARSAGHATTLDKASGAGGVPRPGGSSPSRSAFVDYHPGGTGTSSAARPASPDSRPARRSTVGAAAPTTHWCEGFGDRWNARAEPGAPCCSPRWPRHRRWCASICIGISSNRAPRAGTWHREVASARAQCHDASRTTRSSNSSGHASRHDAEEAQRQLRAPPHRRAEFSRSEIMTSATNRDIDAAA